MRFRLGRKNHKYSASSDQTASDQKTSHQKSSQQPSANRQSVSEEKQRAERAGHLAEWAVLLAYLCCGYWPVARRHKTALGEIDLIMRRNKQIICVEVKYRQSAPYNQYGIPTHKQLRRLKNAMQLIWPAFEAKQFQTIRLDIVVIYGMKGLRWGGWHYFKNC